MRRLKMLKPARTNSALVYRGPSALDGAPIVGIVSGLISGSANSKTGSMLQLWLLPDTPESPHVAQRNGDDSSVCGSCPLRPSAIKLARETGRGYGAYKGEKACYVKTWQAPRSLHAALQRGTIAGDPVAGFAAAVRAARGRSLRLGAFGDPAALPQSSGIIQTLVRAVRLHTAYTHQWRDRRHEWLRPFAMASVETELEHWQAKRQGWRTFHADARPGGAPLARNQVACPATTKHAVQCADCMLCGGASVRARDVWLRTHN